MSFADIVKSGYAVIKDRFNFVKSLSYFEDDPFIYDINNPHNWIDEIGDV